MRFSGISAAGRGWFAAVGVVGAGADAAEFFAGAGDLEDDGFGLKTEPTPDFLFNGLEFGAFEFNDTATVFTDDVAMAGPSGVVGIVDTGFFADFQFSEEATTDQETEGTVNGGSGDGSVALADPVEELFGGKVFVGVLNHFNDGSARPGQTEAMAG